MKMCQSKLAQLLVTGFILFSAIGCKTPAGTSSPSPTASTGSTAGSGNVAKSTMTIGEFDAITVGGVYEVTVKKGKGDLTVEADQDTLSKLNIEVRQGTLHLEMKNVTTSQPVKVTCYSENLEKIELGGATTLTCEELEFSNLRLEVSGNSKLHLKGSAEDVQINFSGASMLHWNALAAEAIEGNADGSAEVILDGETDTLDFELSGASTLKGITAGSATITASGASSASLTILQAGNLTAQGASSISYVGADAKIDMQTSGAGSISESQ